jgi:hypothetical protein
MLSTTCIAEMLLKVAFNQTKPNQSIIFLSGTTSQQVNFVKKYDDKDFIRNGKIVVNASESVGIIRGPETSGTKLCLKER